MKTLAMKSFLILFLFLAALSCQAQNPKMIKVDTTKFMTVKTPPHFPGGRTAWNTFLNKNLHYPDQAVDNEIHGDIVVQFDVDTAGVTSNIKAITGPKIGGLREEAVRIVTLSGNWIPAALNGKKINGTWKETISFKIVK